MARVSWTSLAFTALRPIVKRVGWIAHQLWHEITGSLFIVLAVAGIPSTVHYYRLGQFSAVVLCMSFVLVMLYFGVSAFMRARRIGRQHQHE